MKKPETKECESTGTTKIYESANTTSLKENSVQDITIQEDQMKQCHKYTGAETTKHHSSISVKHKA